MADGGVVADARCRIRDPASAHGQDVIDDGNITEHRAQVGQARWGDQSGEQGEIESPRWGDQGGEKGEIESPRWGDQSGEKGEVESPRWGDDSGEKGEVESPGVSDAATGTRSHSWTEQLLTEAGSRPSRPPRLRSVLAF